MTSIITEEIVSLETKRARLVAYLETTETTMTRLVADISTIDSALGGLRRLTGAPPPPAPGADLARASMPSAAVLDREAAMPLELMEAILADAEQAPAVSIREQLAADLSVFIDSRPPQIHK